MTDQPAAGAPTTAATTPNALKSRTFLGLLVAQFFAAFNDQAIHAAGMFFAINTQTLSEENAITLMPILFYAPWALFSTIAGYFADRYSKRTALITWKIVEVAVAALAMLGFYLGRHGEPNLGAGLVLACVFLMGMHSAFFVPAKYGIMPQILPPEQLSKGNGYLESLSFLAVILGTVSGGVLSYLFLRQEVIVGGILLALAILGAIFSFLIRPVPPANSNKPFPRYIYGPLWDNVQLLWKLPALKLVLMGLVFFTFIVAFMRAAVYMLGESQNPRWDELKTSVIVGTVALGIGLGSPLAGWLSGRRIELRLIQVGAAGMVFLLVLGAFCIQLIPALVVCIVGIGFFTGFFIVPLFTLLQYKAPKTAKGDMIATSNCVNTTGAIAATILFKMVVVLAHWIQLAPPIPDKERPYQGPLTEVIFQDGRPHQATIQTAAGPQTIGQSLPEAEVKNGRTLAGLFEHLFAPSPTADQIYLSNRVPTDAPEPPTVDVYQYRLGDVQHWQIVPAGSPPPVSYDNRSLPRYLFLGCAVLTLCMIIVVSPQVRRVRMILQQENSPMADNNLTPNAPRG